MNEGDDNGASEPTEDDAKRHRELSALAEKVTRPYDAARRQREAAWDRIATPLASPIECATCGQKTDRHIQGSCGNCFVAGVTPQQAAERLQAAPVATEPRCNFCGTPHSQLKQGFTLVRSQIEGLSSAFICSGCAAAAAGCMGATNDVEARRMLAQSAMQAEAVAQSVAMMKRAGDEAQAIIASGAKTNGRSGSFDGVLTLTQAAEALGRIARGGQ